MSGTQPAPAVGVTATQRTLDEAIARWETEGGAVPARARHPSARFTASSSTTLSRHTETPLQARPCKASPFSASSLETVLEYLAKGAEDIAHDLFAEQPRQRSTKR